MFWEVIFMFHSVWRQFPCLNFDKFRDTAPVFIEDTNGDLRSFTACLTLSIPFVGENQKCKGERNKAISKFQKLSLSKRG